MDALLNPGMDQMQNFKISKCSKKDCKYFMLSAQQFDDMSDCEFYHFEEDQRRNPFVVSKNKAQKNLPLLYENEQCEDQTSCCLNLVEYMYHPISFKTMECTVDDCANKFCAFYHTEEEKIMYEQFRKEQKPYSSKWVELNESLSKTNIDKDQLHKNWELEFNPRSSKNVNQDKDRRGSNRGQPQKSLEKNDSSNTLSTKDKKGVKKTAETSKPRNSILSANSQSRSKSKHNEIYRISANSVSKDKNDEGKSKYADKIANKAMSKKGGAGGGGKKGAPLLPNTDKKSQFYLNQEVKMFEDIKTEFKNFTNLEYKTACNYICGFLNSYGGSLYFGINDSGFVKGISLTRQDIDEFQINLDVNLRKFHPKVFPDQYALKFHELASDPSFKKIISNKYVVEIEVKNVTFQNDTYITGEGYCFIKRSGSLNNLSTHEIIEYLSNKNRSLNDSLKKSDDILNGRNQQYQGSEELMNLKRNLEMNILPKISSILTEGGVN